jgi:hypothetical protein
MRIKRQIQMLSQMLIQMVSQMINQMLSQIVKRVSTLKLNRLQKISVIVVIGLFLGTGLIAAIDGNQIQTSVIKDDNIELSSVTKITNAKFLEFNEINFSSRLENIQRINLKIVKDLAVNNTQNVSVEDKQNSPSKNTQNIVPENLPETPPSSSNKNTQTTPEKTVQPPSNPQPTSNKITNSKGNSWSASGDNIQVAINNLNGPGDVWLPAATLTVNKNIYISRSGVKIHGQGSKTVIVFHNARLISAKNADSTSDTQNFQGGLDNIQLDNFKFTGNGNIELTLGKNTQLYNIFADNVTCDRPGAFRFIIPTGSKYANNLIVSNCHTYKTCWHGFFINALAAYSTIENVKFLGCTARYAGWPFPAENKWSVGFHLCEYYGSTKQGDMTIKNVLIKDCTAEYSWESGFHFEVRPDKINVTLDHCVAQYNGQKWHYYNESYPYMSGFMGLLKDITLKNCVSNYNTHCGYKGSTATGFKSAVFINCTGKGNFDGLTDRCKM